MKEYKENEADMLVYKQKAGFNRKTYSEVTVSPTSDYSASSFSSSPAQQSQNMIDLNFCTDF